MASDADSERSMEEKSNTHHWGPVGELVGVGRYDAGALGELWLGWTAAGLAKLRFAAEEVAFPPGVPELELPEVYRGALDAYARRDPHAFDGLPLDLRGTDFQRQVWEALRAVPFGEVRSYAGIAADIDNPRAMRAVGMANGQNPVAIVVPCHRIVEAKGALGGYTGGVEHKVALLRHEGVRVEDGRVRPGQLALF